MEASVNPAAKVENISDGKKWEWSEIANEQLTKPEQYLGRRQCLIRINDLENQIPKIEMIVYCILSLHSLKTRNKDQKHWVTISSKKHSEDQIISQQCPMRYSAKYATKIINKAYFVVCR